MELSGDLHTMASSPLRKEPQHTMYGKLGQIQSRVGRCRKTLSLVPSANLGPLLTQQKKLSVSAADI
jgi:hypothetical protein